MFLNQSHKSPTQTIPWFCYLQKGQIASYAIKYYRIPDFLESGNMDTQILLVAHWKSQLLSGLVWAKPHGLTQAWKCLFILKKYLAAKSLHIKNVNCTPSSSLVLAKQNTPNRVINIISSVKWKYSWCCC